MLLLTSTCTNMYFDQKCCNTKQKRKLCDLNRPISCGSLGSEKKNKPLNLNFKSATTCFIVKTYVTMLYDVTKI